jgi:hypothetical protein
VTVNADGSFGYTPAASFAGADSFGYTVTDASGDTVSGTAVITVTAVNTSPAADLAVSLSCPSSLSAGRPAPSMPGTPVHQYLHQGDAWRLSRDQHGNQGPKFVAGNERSEQPWPMHPAPAR